MADPRDREPLLRAYAWVYLEEELRREALIRDWPTFARFLRLAAAESGNIVNYAKIAREAGIASSTVRSHYQLLEDMFVGFHVPAMSGSPRKSVLSTPRFVFFDAGVRHAAAGLVPGPDTVLANPGPIFEQWVATELHRRLSYRGSGSLAYYRTKGGTEVDLVLELGDEIVPNEVKWTDKPSPHDARHLRPFLVDHPRARRAVVVCRCPRPQQLDDNVTALPWWMV
jgi:predicted AAA+ superfamily ATPase